MSHLDLDFEPVRRLMQAAISGPKDLPKPPLPASAWKWATAGQLLRARLAGRMATGRHVPRKTWMPVAAAIELVHAASLLHDDVIDGALLRRHAPALWTLYGPRLAILAGDLLLTAAFDLLEDGGRSVRAVIPWLVNAARITCVNEMRHELSPGTASTSDGQLLDYARGKTGPLFGLAAAGTLSPDTPDKRLAFWEETGNEVGVIYQIADDIADATATAADTGKTMGLDATRNLSTCARFATAETLRKRLDELDLSVALSPIPTPGERLAFHIFLQSDLLPSLRPLSPQPPRRSPTRKARPRQ